MPPLRALLLTPALAACALLPGACNIAAPVALALAGPPKVPAVFEPDPNRVTVILIDDPGNKVPRRELRMLVGQTADDELLRSKTYPPGKLIASKSAMQAARGAEPGPKLSVVDIGRRVGAEVVIYAEVVEWSLAPRADSIAPRAGLNVRLLDTLSNQRIFPEDGGFTVSATLPEESLSKQTNRSAADRGLARALGLSLARAFYEHERPKLQNNRPTLQ